MREAFQSLQNGMPWTGIWSAEFQKDPRSYAGFQHCLTNIAAKLGAIFQRIEMADHYGPEYELALDRDKDGKDLAFVIMSAMKAANAYPGGPIDLSRFIESDLNRRVKDAIPKVEV
jgi:hypothetical protein